MSSASTYIITIVLLYGASAYSDIFYIDSQNGSDSGMGTNEKAAWRSLVKANETDFKPGDRLLLKRGSRFKGGLNLQLKGTKENPIQIGAYGEGRAPLIDARGHIAGVFLRNSAHVAVRDLEITADGGATVDGTNPDRRYGVFVRGTFGQILNITLEKLTIYKIYPEIGTEHEGHNETTFLGTGIAISGNREEPGTDMIIRDCRIAQTGFKAISLNQLRNVAVLNNQMKDIGGPAIQPGNVTDLVVRGNTVDGSGSSLDPRMHMRGSGIWPWTCERVLIEKNKFMHARGKGDSCGIHIDYNCRDVVVQYNLSINNEGGFSEILGNNHNCAYRYNISINDGFRVKGENKAFQEGKILWTSGYIGKKREKQGPYNTYIYNNTIYTKPGSRSCFAISSTTDGILIANNIFHIMGSSLHVPGDQDKRKVEKIGQIPRSHASNNLLYQDDTLPDELPLDLLQSFTGNPGFAKPGGFSAENYIPKNTKLVKNRGIKITPLKNDTIGLRLGLDVSCDILGNPIIGPPDLGAIEISGQ